MEVAAIMQIIAFAIAEGPAAFTLATKIIADVKSKFNTPDERLTALNAILALMTPMVKEG
jgi:hypothetical protein